jgi:hypothetical protein
MAVLAQAASSSGFWTPETRAAAVTGAVALVVGVAGFLAAAWTASHARKAAEASAEQQRYHDVAMRTDERAHETEVRRSERRHELRASFYIDLLTTVLRGNDSMTWTEPFYKEAGDPDPPEPLGQDQQRLLTAQIDGLASTEVRSIVHRWQDVVRQFNEHWRMKVRFDKQRWTPEDDSPQEHPGSVALKGMYECRGNGRALYEELAAQVSDELMDG